MHGLRSHVSYYTDDRTVKRMVIGIANSARQFKSGDTFELVRVERNEIVLQPRVGDDFPTPRTVILLENSHHHGNSNQLEHYFSLTMSRFPELAKVFGDAGFGRTATTAWFSDGVLRVKVPTALRPVRYRKSREKRPDPTVAQVAPAAPAPAIPLFQMVLDFKEAGGTRVFEVPMEEAIALAFRLARFEVVR